MKVKKIQAIIYKVYFHHDEKDIKEPLFCVVIANNIQEVVEKVKQVWPKEVINSIFTDDRPSSFGDQQVRTIDILL